MLARDILAHIRDEFPLLYSALHRYVIGERSPALREVQSFTLKPFEGKGESVGHDARECDKLRQRMADSVPSGVGPGGMRGVIVSNELFDEFDPVKLRLVWRRGHLPTAADVARCASWREVYVVHTIQRTALRKVLSWGAESGKLTGIFPEAVSDRGPLPVDEAVAGVEQQMDHEALTLPCEMVPKAAMQAFLTMARTVLTAEEHQLCLPAAVCCYPLLLALDLVQSEESITVETDGPDPWYLQKFIHLYRLNLAKYEQHVFVSKYRYRQLRKLVRLDKHLEFQILRPTPARVNASVPFDDIAGCITTTQIALSLEEPRCRELGGYLRRHAERYAQAATIHESIEPPTPFRIAHVKTIMRPGEEEFMRATAGLIDHGFALTVDYGADADGLLWHHLIRPNYDGIHTMDARTGLHECTHTSHLQCPGLQDLTTSVDFTEVAEAGVEYGWKLKAYTHQWDLERSYYAHTPEVALHMLERVGNTRTNLGVWYLRQEEDPWAFFKVMVQQRGDEGGIWFFPGAMQLPVFRRSLLEPAAHPCWDSDMTRPALVDYLMRKVRDKLADETAEVAPAKQAEGVASDPRAALKPFLDEYMTLYTTPGAVGHVMMSESEKQRQLHQDVVLALMVADYWRSLMIPDDPADPHGCLRISTSDEGAARALRVAALNRRLDRVFGQEHFDRVFDELVAAQALDAHGSVFKDSQKRYPTYVCAAHQAIQDYCNMQDLG